jgi:hypothetical protein
LLRYLSITFSIFILSQFATTGCRPSIFKRQSDGQLNIYREPDESRKEIHEDNIVDEKIHEHDFISIKTEKEASSICSTCGLLYCENCGKAVNDTLIDLYRFKLRCTSF